MSAVCFFVLILNNAAALRTGNEHQKRARLPEMVDFQIRNGRQNCVSASIMIDFQIVNERRKHACLAEMVDFERVNGRQLRVSASKIIEFQIASERQSRVFASEIVDFEESV